MPGRLTWVFEFEPVLAMNCAAMETIPSIYRLPGLDYLGLDLFTDLLFEVACEK
jgi:hypothetical protein